MKVLLVGSGLMATEYSRVLTALHIEFEVVGRGQKNCQKIEKQFSVKVFSGGIESFVLENNLLRFSHIINCVNIHFLFEITKTLIEHGAKKILLEKPGALNINHLEEMFELSRKNDVRLLIAFNRRFYASVQALKNFAERDGGIISAHFEFTEWIHTINPRDYDKKTLNKWIISNSSHVIDTIFFIIGNPETMKSKVFGESKISWHPSGSVFYGLGKSIKNIPFTYHANWQSAGRWTIKILTKKECYYLEPLEILKRQEIGTINIETVKLKYNLDEDHKPGLYSQVKNFLNNNLQDFCTIEHHLKNTKNIYYKIANY